MKAKSTWLLVAMGVLVGCATAPEDDVDDTVEVDVEADTLRPQPSGSTASSSSCVCSGGYRWCRDCSSCGWYRTGSRC